MLGMGSSSSREERFVSDGILHETHLNVTKTSYTWIIHKFSQRRDMVGDIIESSIFSSSGQDNSKWSLVLYPGGLKYRSSLGLFLRCVSTDCSSVLAEFEFSLLGKGGLKAENRKATGRFTPNITHGFPKYIDRDSLLEHANRFLPNDKLIIHCEVSAFLDTPPSGSVAVNVPECRLSQDLGDLLQSRRCCDVVLSAAGQEVHAHKIILAARCPVFAAMFVHEMKEEREGRVEVTDCDFEVLREVVEFIYTGRAPRVNEMAEKVLAAANKYDLGRLKAICEDVLCPKLSVETAAEMLVLADTHNADQLKANVLRFIKANTTDVMDTDGWKTMAGDKPDLVALVLRALSLENEALKAEFVSKSREANQEQIK